jgi:hypothetical protein
MSQPPGDLQQQVEEFGRETAGLLSAALPRLPVPPIEILRREARYVIRHSGKGLPLYVHGDELAKLDLSVACQLDSVGRYLAVERSSFGLLAALDRTPVLRIDYRRDMHTAPAAHIQVHAHRGALSHLLSRAGHPFPHDMSALHIPVGGARFRPCLEDFIQFLIAECRFDSLSRWEACVQAGRERWRRRQAAAVTRDMPEEAARVLRELGYKVESPEPPPEDVQKALYNW